MNVGGQGRVGGTCVASRPRSWERAAGGGHGVFPGHPAAKTLLCICKRAHGIVRPRCHPATAAWEPPARGSFSHGRWVRDDTSAHTHVRVHTPPCVPRVPREAAGAPGAAEGRGRRRPGQRGSHTPARGHAMAHGHGNPARGSRACTGTQHPDTHTRSALAAPGGFAQGALLPARRRAGETEAGRFWGVGGCPAPFGLSPPAVTRRGGGRRVGHPGRGRVMGPLLNLISLGVKRRIYGGSRLRLVAGGWRTARGCPTLKQPVCLCVRARVRVRARARVCLCVRQGHCSYTRTTPPQPPCASTSTSTGARLGLASILRSHTRAWLCQARRAPSGGGTAPPRDTGGTPGVGPKTQRDTTPRRGRPAGSADTCFGRVSACELTDTRPKHA